MTDTSLDYALRRLDKIGSNLRLPSHRGAIDEVLPELRDILQLLEYHCTPKNGIDAPIVALFGPAVSCQEDGCMKSWRDHDACLLSFNGSWLCRDHHPPLKDGGIRPVGWIEPQDKRDETDMNRRAALATVSRAQLRLINSRVGG